MKFQPKTISKDVIIREVLYDELEGVFPLINQLRSHLSLTEYLNLVKIMRKTGYQIICLFENNKAVSYAGVAKSVNLHHGNHIYIYDLVTDTDLQGKGYGKTLLSHIEKWAEENSLSYVSLSSGFQRIDAHKFYEKSMAYTKTSYCFQKNLT